MSSDVITAANYNQKSKESVGLQSYNQLNPVDAI
jgi:hypothetical protein